MAATTNDSNEHVELIKLSLFETKFLCVLIDSVTRRGLFGAADMRTYGDLYQRTLENANKLANSQQTKQDATMELSVDDCILILQAIETGATHGGIFLAIEYKDLGDIYNTLRQWVDQNAKVENAKYELNEGRNKFYASLLDILARRGIYGGDEFITVGEFYNRLKKSADNQEETAFISIVDCRIILNSIEAGSKRKGTAIFLPYEFHDVGTVYLRLKLWLNKYQQQQSSTSSLASNITAEKSTSSIQTLSLKDIQ